MTVAAVMLWGRQIGAVSVDGPGTLPTFQYTPEFVASQIEVSPVAMPLRTQPYSFPELARIPSFQGLPGLVADALPDRWGQSLVSAWLQAQGRAETDFDVVERLCYAGSRAMGALEFEPALAPETRPGDDLRVDLLVELASEVLTAREQFAAHLASDTATAELAALVTLGTSAGGARPKAVIAFNEETGQVRSGQVDAGKGFSHWLLKFDGVQTAGDHGLTDPQGWGAVEYGYWQMARAAGIDIADARLLEEGPRRHFMTRRFDRTPSGGKVHVQTLAAIEHLDYDVPGLYSYEQLFGLARRLGLDATAVEQLYRRMVFNVIARNQDDHVKNTAFVMQRDGVWTLAPAYDLTWSYAPSNRWLQAHQMTVNGKRDEFVAEDLRAAADAAGLPRGRWKRVVDQVSDVVSGWPTIAGEIGVDPRLADAAAATHRLALAGEVTST